jgi:hypothetical protein
MDKTESPYFSLETRESRLKARYLSDLVTLFFSKLSRAYDSNNLDEAEKQKLRNLLERIFEVKEKTNITK